MLPKGSEAAVTRPLPREARRQTCKNQWYFFGVSAWVHHENHWKPERNRLHKCHDTWTNGLGHMVSAKDAKAPVPCEWLGGWSTCHAGLHVVWIFPNVCFMSWSRFVLRFPFFLGFFAELLRATSLRLYETNTQITKPSHCHKAIQPCKPFSHMVTLLNLSHHHGAHGFLPDFGSRFQVAQVDVPWGIAWQVSGSIHSFAVAGHNGYRGRSSFWHARQLAKSGPGAAGTAWEHAVEQNHQQIQANPTSSHCFPMPVHVFFFFNMSISKSACWAPHLLELTVRQAIPQQYVAVQPLFPMVSRSWWTWWKNGRSPI